MKTRVRYCGNICRLGAEAWRRGSSPSSFSIDVQHELALYLWKDGPGGVNLTHAPSMCRRYRPNCATWMKPFQPCVSQSHAVVLPPPFVNEDLGC